MSDTQRGMQEFSYMEIEHQLRLGASPAHVFGALCGDLSAWWGAPYLQDAASLRVVLEPRPGGRLYEVWSDEPGQCAEEGALWGVVTQIADAELIVLEGGIGMPWPVLGHVTFELKPVGGERTSAPQSDLRLNHRAWGKVSEAMRESYDWGWKDLLSRRLRSWVERGERMGIGHEPLPWDEVEPPDTQ